MSPFHDNENEDFKELVRQFKRAVDDKIPLFYDADEYEEVIHYLLQMGDLMYADVILQRAVEQFPDDPYFRLLRVRYHVYTMNIEQAKRDLVYIENNFEPFPEFYIEKVFVAHACNMVVDNKSLLEKALELDERQPEAHILLVHECLKNEENLDDAVKHAMRAIQLNPEAADELKLVTVDFQGVFGINQHQVLLFYERMTKILPMNGSIWNGMGLAFMNFGRFKEAQESFQFQLSLDENDITGYCSLAEAYFSEGEYQKSIDNFKEAQSHGDPDSYAIQLGRCYYHLQKYEEAMSYFLQIQEDDPMYAFVVIDIVRVLKAQCKFEEARTFLRGRIKNNPSNMDAVEELVDLLDPERDSEEVLSLSRRLLQDDEVPLYAYLYFFTNYCCRTESEDLGIKFLFSYLNDPDVEVSVHYFMAVLYLRLGQIKKGCEYLENALQMDPHLCLNDFDGLDEALSRIPEVHDLMDFYRVYDDDEDFDDDEKETRDFDVDEDDDDYF